MGRCFSGHGFDPLRKSAWALWHGVAIAVTHYLPLNFTGQIDAGQCTIFSSTALASSGGRTVKCGAPSATYEPLYQAAYLLGGMQIYALHRELVGDGRMTNRQFHDAVLKENNIALR